MLVCLSRKSFTHSHLCRDSSEVQNENRTIVAWQKWVFLYTKEKRKVGHSFILNVMIQNIVHYHYDMQYYECSNSYLLWLHWTGSAVIVLLLFTCAYVPILLVKKPFVTVSKLIRVLCALLFVLVLHTTHLSCPCQYRRVFFYVGESMFLYVFTQWTRWWLWLV